MEPVLISQGCHNKIPHTAGAENNINFLPHGSGGQKSEIEMRTGPCSL